MSLFFLAIMSLPIALAVVALSWWVQSRRDSKERPNSEAERRLAAPKFDTTLGELREMREALRPTERPVSEPDRSTGESRDGIGQPHIKLH